MTSKQDIRLLTLEDLIAFFNKNGVASFRAKQVYEWLWKKRAINFNEMTSLSIANRNLLKKYFSINNIDIHKSEQSSDKTIKYSLKLHDNKLVEGVIIPSKNRLTACVSSQAGCSLACTFCATGTLKLERNLNFSEIYDQVYILNEEAKLKFGKPLSNIVYMGMGEPLLNYDNLIKSVELITNKQGLGMSPKRITVSTAGIAKMIKKLADDEVKFNLALSLHTADDEKRNSIMPINKSIDLTELKEAVKYFYNKTGTRVTYEYILFDGVNDTLEDANKLLKFCKKTPCKVNLIEYNQVDGFAYKKSSKKRTNAFIEYLEERNIIVNLRRSKGKDINAACGQLVNKLK
tara:strand:+ start:309 stop:1349 length:1041 start_codon:yes stop_codon:yes gene_type:complete